MKLHRKPPIILPGIDKNIIRAIKGIFRSEKQLLIQTCVPCMKYSYDRWLGDQLFLNINHTGAVLDTCSHCLCALTSSITASPKGSLGTSLSSARWIAISSCLSFWCSSTFHLKSMYTSSGKRGSTSSSTLLSGVGGGGAAATSPLPFLALAPPFLVAFVAVFVASSLACARAADSVSDATRKRSVSSSESFRN